MWVSAVFPAVVAECIAMVLSLYNGQYSFERMGILRYIGRAIKGTVYFVGVWGAMLLIQKNSISDSRYFFVTTMAFHFIILLVLLYAVQNYMIMNFYKTDAATLVAIIADRKSAAKASCAIKKDWSRKIAGIMLSGEERGSKNKKGLSEAVAKTETSIKGIKSRISGKDTELSPEEIDHVPVLAYGKEIVDCVRASAIDEVFIFSPEGDASRVEELIEEFAQMGLPVHLNLANVEKLERHLNDETKAYIPKIETRLGFIEKSPMAIFETPTVKLRYELLKRVIDVLGGLVGAVFAVILYVIVGIAIKLDSPGPVIFAQERIGKNGRRFKMYKFRSMYIDAEERKAELMKQNEMSGLMFKMKDDPRITKVGKFIRKTSLDEFPQFFNVLMGDMSLVGTRPPTVSEFKEYSNYHKRRLSMKPGITGMWQVSGRSDITDFEEVVKLDCKYIDNWSLGLDVKILVKTVMAVVMRKGSE